MRSLCSALRATTNGQTQAEWRSPTAHTLEGSRHHLHNGAILRKTKGKTAFLNLLLILIQYRLIMAEIVGRNTSEYLRKK
jgi:hypothetical protein